MATKPKNGVSHIHRHFRNADPALYAILKEMPLEPLQAEVGSNRYFYKLCREIISQQLGNKAADAIHKRFLGLFAKSPTPQDVVAISEEQIRAIGTSGAKARYIRNLAAMVIAGDVKLTRLRKLENEEVIAELTKIKGIGRWTAEMFLIFTLGREDVFSFGDLGLAHGITALYGKPKTRTQKHIETITKNWSPYRSYGSLALWHYMDSKK
jgi:DNA-3-methyladenine glycosylase II